MHVHLHTHIATLSKRVYAQAHIPHRASTHASCVKMLKQLAEIQVYFVLLASYSNRSFELFKCQRAGDKARQESLPSMYRALGLTSSTAK